MNKQSFKNFKEKIDLLKNNPELEKIEYIKSHIIKKYVPVAEKQVILNIMVNKAKSKTVHDVNYLDQLLLKINFDLAVIILYTDIDISSSDIMNQMEIYDYFKQNKIINHIYSVIGEEEITELAMVQQYIIDSFYEVENSIQEIIRSNLDRYGKSFEAVLSPILPMLIEKLNDTGDEDKNSLFKEIINK